MAQISGLLSLWLLKFWSESFLLFPLNWIFQLQCCSSFLPLTKIPSYFQSWLFWNTDWPFPDEHVKSSLKLPRTCYIFHFVQIRAKVLFLLLWITQWLPISHTDVSCLCSLMTCTTEGRGCHLKLLSELFKADKISSWQSQFSHWCKPMSNKTCLERKKCRNSCLLPNGIWEGLNLSQYLLRHLHATLEHRGEVLTSHS